MSPTTVQSEREVTGIVFDIQRYSVHDGPGLRTNVFLKGCPLHCAWCANPESQHPHPELALFNTRCISCGQFDATCGHLRASQPNAKEFAERIEQCPVEAVFYFGQERTVASVMDEVCRDKPFYQGGGGLTLTGGEPTRQPRFAEALLKAAKREGISTAMETCGHASWKIFQRLLLYLGTILFDFKHIDSATHQKYTGLGNELILSNLEKLTKENIQLVIRIPLIPGFNTSEKTLRNMADFIAQQLNAAIARVDLLPYHTIGKNKYEALDQPYPWEGQSQLKAEEVEFFSALFREQGLPVTVGG